MNEAIAEQKFAKKDIFQYFFKKIFLQFLRWFCQSQQKILVKSIWKCNIPIHNTGKSKSVASFSSINPF